MRTRRPRTSTPPIMPDGPPTIASAATMAAPPAKPVDAMAAVSTSAGMPSATNRAISLSNGNFMPSSVARASTPNEPKDQPPLAGASVNCNGIVLVIGSEVVRGPAVGCIVWLDPGGPLAINLIRTCLHLGTIHTPRNQMRVGQILKFC